MRARPAILGAVLALAARTQATNAQATIAGVVFDSIAHAPLARATVQLVAVDVNARAGRAAVTDSLGRFTMSDVAAGHYLIGFLHPMLDSLGLEPPVHELHVVGDRMPPVDLAIPSAGRLRTVICGADSGGLLVGVVRDASNRDGVGGATVTADWLELSFTTNGRVSLTPTRTATTSATGWFAMCGVPRSGSVTLMASREMDSTERVEVEIARDAFLRRELFLGSRRAAANARLNGIVISALDGSPLAFADVGIARGPQTRTNEHGEWTLSDAPLGTHMLDVRAVGYYPAHRAVDVVGEPSTVSVALRTMKAVLDTVKINAREAAETHRAEFEGRRRTGIGRYLTDGEIAGRHPVATSDLFARQTDVDVVKNARSQERFIQMRALGTPCRPAVYIDGQNMNSLTADDIDNAVRPEEIAGIEIYSGAVSPPEFASGSGGVGAERGGRRAQDPRVCGSIVIWTKPAQHVSTGLSWRQRLSIAAGIGAIALVLELLF